MPKIFEGDTRPFDEALELILLRLNQVPPSSSDRRIAIIPLKGRSELADALRERVRPGICLTYPQRKQLFTDMRKYLLNPDPDKKDQLIAMANAINLYRNTCADCLNGACIMRDPKCPLQ